MGVHATECVATGEREGRVEGVYVCSCYEQKVGEGGGQLFVCPITKGGSAADQSGSSSSSPPL